MKNTNKYSDDFNFFSSDLSRIKNNRNPEFLLEHIHRDLLIKIAQGQIRPKKIAVRELQKRGLNRDGRWIGISRDII